MSAEAPNRKLAAIMFTDMVGYRALAQRDGKLALELLEKHRPESDGAKIRTEAVKLLSETKQIGPNK